MLAYVFWHWPQSNVSQQEYETQLADFHRTLAHHPSPGFNRSFVYKFENPSWLVAEGVVYEEWYLVDDSAALDPLNVAAVSGPCEVPHNRVARNASGGTAGLYRWRDGVRDFSDARYATWLAKPAGVSYPDFYTQIHPLLTESALWGRQMTLGPTAEFCIQSKERVELPPGFSAEELELVRVW